MSSARKVKAIACAAVGCIALLAPASATAAFDITEVGGAFSMHGQLTRQAGSHADLATTVKFTQTIDPNYGSPSADGNFKDVRAILPAGLIGDPTEIPTCTDAQLIEYSSGKDNNCPIGAQVGIIDIDQPGSLTRKAVYNMPAPADLPARFGFIHAGIVIILEPRLRADHRIEVTVTNTSQAQTVLGSTVTFWGVPADLEHDQDRWDPNKAGIEAGAFGAVSPAPRTPFMTLPTYCGDAPLSTTYSANSWQEPDVFHSASYDVDYDGTPFKLGGCERLPFEPEMKMQALPGRSSAPNGLDVDVTVPQSSDPYGLATAHVRKTVVKLPEGWAVSPGAAAGQAGCSSAQIDLASAQPPSCPGASVLGSVEIETPLLEKPLRGRIILASQGDNPFGSLLAVYLVAEGSGVVLKLPGQVGADPRTGQLTTTFADTPQLPFEELRLRFRRGEDAPLVAPARCGTEAAAVEMTSWASDKPVVFDVPLKVDEGCGGGGFDPRLQAATSNPIAGSSSPFTFRVVRNDGEQNISRIQTTLPEGLLAKLAGVPVCGDAAAASGACPAASQVGAATVAAGAGSSPLFVPQPGKAPTAVYLAGPFKGAPYSLVVEVPAQAGPFDLGTVVVRSTIAIDPATTAVSVTSDPLPQILEGIPIAYRDIRVAIDRPGFTLNPTSCEPMRVRSRIVSALGQSADPSARFQATSCERLAFKPKLALKLSGPTRRSAEPRLRAILTMPQGGANIAKVRVTLPPSESLEQAHIRTICTRVQYRAGSCPRGSIYGRAKAWSPLLDKPLQGPVYLRSSNHTLPDLVASLDGQIHVDLAGRIDSEGGGIRTSFWAVPDAPVTKFALTMFGGEKGLLVNGTDLCRGRHRSLAVFDAHNGKGRRLAPVVKADCAKR